MPDSDLSPNDQRDNPAVSPTHRHTAVGKKLAHLIAPVFTASDARKKAVIEDISLGSVPNPVYYMLLGLSELIAGFGLLVDSATVLIGANVVAPLMTPIFGISLGLSRGDLPLLRQALVAEFGGATLGVLLVFFLGLFPLPLQETPLLLAQTEPTLIDLLVAALAGLAGCLAMIDERVSPALPGVAIATSLNPPLAAIGLCLARGAYHGAWGAFLLFLANFLAILLVSAIIFIVAGFITRREIGSTTGFLLRFSMAGVGLIAITILLTHSLLRLVQDWRTTRTISAVLTAELADEPTTTIDKFEYNRQESVLSVLSTIRTPQVLSPRKVKDIEEALARRLGENVSLFFRCSITRDIAATGAVNLLAQRSLDGTFIKTESTPDAQVLQFTEQAVRELLLDIPNVTLNNIELVKIPTGSVIVVSIEGPREPLPSRVQRAEQHIRERVGDPHLRLLVRTTASFDISSKGRVLLGQAHFDEQTAEAAALQLKVEQTTKSEIEKLPNLFVTSIDAVNNLQNWEVRAEVVGPRVLSPKEVQTIEKALFNLVGQPIQLTVWARTDVIVTGERYSSVQGYREATAPQQPPTPETQAASEENADVAP
jgi:uncharacterized hydrophobic protein (TIGR00271 family)